MQDRGQRITTDFLDDQLKCQEEALILRANTQPISGILVDRLPTPNAWEIKRQVDGNYRWKLKYRLRL
jgi:hypothetical protein